MKRLGPVLVVLIAGVLPAGGSGPDASAGELNIEGKFVEKLVLDNNRGVFRVIENPGSSWSLPADRYRVWEVHLPGGYSCSANPADKPDWFSVTTEQPCRLEVGAPLTPNVKVRRSFRRLELDYELLDAGGRNYGGPKRGDPPDFAIYSGDRRIASGSFEYG